MSWVEIDVRVPQSHSEVRTPLRGGHDGAGARGVGGSRDS